MAKGGYSDDEVLEIFVESVEELLKSNFVAEIEKDGVSTKTTWSEESGFISQRIGPRKDSVKAFLLTLRFFGQNNEPTSLCNMEERINGLGVDRDLKKRFRDNRNNFNSFLDNPPCFTFPAESNANSRRQILETFLYGIFAHANPKYRRQVKAWENALFYDEIRAQFDLVLLEYLRLLIVLAEICRKCVNVNTTEAGTAADGAA